MSEPITLFWQPGCTSCLRVKEFLRSHDVAFNSINIADDPSGLEQLSKYGIKTVPILTQGDRFIFAQVLGEVACFLGLEEDSVQPLPIHELALKLRMVLAAAQRYVHQIPVSHLNHVLPGRIRTYRELGYHIFRIAECFLEAAAGTTLTDENLNAPPCENLQTGADTARDSLKPTVLAFATLLPVTSRSVEAARIPLKPILKAIFVLLSPDQASRICLI